MGLRWNANIALFLDFLNTKEKITGPFLIVTPLSTIGNWEREIKGWTDMNVVVYHGSQTSRNLIVETEFYYRKSDGTVEPNIFKFDVPMRDIMRVHVLHCAHQLEESKQSLPWQY